MKKIIIIIMMSLALLTAAMLIPTRVNDNRSNAETNVVMSDDSGIYAVTKKSDTQSDSEIIQRMDAEKTIAEILSDFDWVNRAVLTISDSDNGSVVTAILTVNREPSPDEANSAAYVIAQYVDEDADILITDQDSDVIYPLSD